jgi:hypothetical protein
LVVVVMNQICEDLMENKCSVGEGDEGDSGSLIAGASVGEEADGSEVGKVGCVLGVVEEGWDFFGEGEGEGGCASSELLGLLEGAGVSVVAAEDVSDGGGVDMVFSCEVLAAVALAVLADDVDFGADV